MLFLKHYHLFSKKHKKSWATARLTAWDSLNFTQEMRLLAEHQVEDNLHLG